MSIRPEGTPTATANLRARPTRRPRDMQREAGNWSAVRRTAPKNRWRRMRKSGSQMRWQETRTDRAPMGVPRPSIPDYSVPHRQAAMRPGKLPGTGPRSKQNVQSLESYQYLQKLFGSGCCGCAWWSCRNGGSIRGLAFLQCVGGLGRHIVLVVLGQHFFGVHHAIGLDLALRNHALAFLEQVRQDAFEYYRDAFMLVGDHKIHRQTIHLALHAAFLDQAADAEAASVRGFIVKHLGRGEIQADILVQCV